MDPGAEDTDSVVLNLSECWTGWNLRRWGAPTPLTVSPASSGFQWHGWLSNGAGRFPASIRWNPRSAERTPAHLWDLVVEAGEAGGEGATEEEPSLAS